MILSALTLWQPYASLIALGVKPYETRHRQAPAFMLGQRIAIHAAARKPGVMEITREIHEAMATATGNQRWFPLLPLGRVVCTAVLAEVLKAEDVLPDPYGDYTPGRFAWHFVDVKPLRPPVEAKGQQRYGWAWTVPESVAI